MDSFRVLRVRRLFRCRTFAHSRIQNIILPQRPLKKYYFATTAIENILFFHNGHWKNLILPHRPLKKWPL
jgi:hypothetical protein